MIVWVVFDFVNDFSELVYVFVSVVGVYVRVFGVEVFLLEFVYWIEIIDFVFS